MMIHLGIQGSFRERLFQTVKKSVRIKGRLGIGPSQKLVQDGIRNMRLFASRHGWAPFHPSCPPTHEIPDSLDYGLRWGIEAMFSDFKTRGFNLEASQIERTDRLDRLVLVLALALYWAVSTGLWDALENRAPAEKKPRQRTARMSPAA